MFYFWALLCYIIVFAFFYRKKKNNSTWISIIVLLFPMWYLHVFADPMTMGDTPQYCEMFKAVSTLSVKDILTHNIQYEYLRFETGWLLFNKLISSVTTNQQALIFIVGTIIMGSYGYVIKKYSPTPWLSALILLCTIYPQSLFVLRQHLALALCLLSIQFCIERKILKTGIFVLLAATLHTSAILFLLLYFLYGVKINGKFYLWALITTIFLYAGSLAFLGYLVGNGMLDTYYSTYFDNVNNYSDVIITSLELLFVSLFYKIGKNLDGIEKISYLQLIVALVLAISALNSPLGGRITSYFTVGQILIFPLCVIKDKNSAIWNVLIASAFIAFALVRSSDTWLESNLVNLSLI